MISRITLNVRKAAHHPEYHHLRFGETGQKMSTFRTCTTPRFISRNDDSITTAPIPLDDLSSQHKSGEYVVHEHGEDELPSDFTSVQEIKRSISTEDV